MLKYYENKLVANILSSVASLICQEGKSERTFSIFLFFPFFLIFTVFFPIFGIFFPLTPSGYPTEYRLLYSAFVHIFSSQNDHDDCKYLLFLLLKFFAFYENTNTGGNYFANTSIPLSVSWLYCTTSSTHDVTCILSPGKLHFILL